MIKNFVSQALNVCLIMIIANLNLNNVEFVQDIHRQSKFSRLFFAGLHPEFTRFWYINVGVSILVIKTISIVWPQILSIIFMVPACALRRICCAHKAVFQFAMNKYYEGLNVNLWDRYASILTNNFFALTFSSGMPLILPLQTLCLIFQYWMDKILCKLYLSLYSGEICEKTTSLWNATTQQSIFILAICNLLPYVGWIFCLYLSSNLRSFM